MLKLALIAALLGLLWWTGILQFILWFWGVLFMWAGSLL